MNASFDHSLLCRRLIGGMDLRAFDEGIRESRWARFESAIESSQLGQLFDLARLESLLGSDGIPMSYVDVFDDGFLRRLSDVQKKSGKSSLDVIADNFSRGSTIRVRDLDRFDARLGQCVAAISRFFFAQSQVNVYLTPPAKTGFPPHFDITDVFIVQCAGSKQWMLYPDYSEREELPLATAHWDPARYRPTGPAESVTLSPGDVLYLPRGVMHEAYCTERESMHLTITLAPLTIADLMAKALAAACAADPGLRRRVPFQQGQAELNKIAGRIRAELAGLGDRVDVESLLSSELQAFEREPRAEPAGPLAAVIANLSPR